MEFLGDALLGAIVAEDLWERLPRSDEGELTRVRTRVVRESALAEVARRNGVSDALVMGPGEMKSGGRRRDSVLADATEALIAAIFLDAGWEACRERVRDCFAQVIEGALDTRFDRDPKTRLQEWLQSRQLALPEYELLSVDGPEHERVFQVRCRVIEPAQAAIATGASRKQAEVASADAVCKLLGLDPGQERASAVA